MFLNAYERKLKSLGRAVLIGRSIHTLQEIINEQNKINI